MAIFGDDQGKTEQPTPSRLAEVRNRGDSPLSRELVQGGVLMVAALVFEWCGAWLVDSLIQVMRRGLVVDLAGRTLDRVSGACQEVLGAALLVVPPFATLVATLVATTVVLGYGQIGVKWSREVLGFKLERLNPAANWKRVFNVQALVRTGFAAVKLAIVVGVLWAMLGDRWQMLLRLHEQPLAQAAAEIAAVVLGLMFWVGAVVFALSFLDLAWQRFSFTQRNMMTRQEVEDERRRFSVALRYDRRRDVAPTVVAKGVDEMALRIRELAREHGVPLMEDPPLARALFRAVKVGQAIPERFYQAVATVLSHVYRLQGRTA